MAPETESERISRINASQLNARAGNPLQKTSAKTRSRQKAAAQPSLIVELFRMLPAWLRDVLVAVGYGLIPAILVFIFLPNAFKLLGILVLLGAGLIGYMRGEVTD